MSVPRTLSRAAAVAVQRGRAVIGARRARGALRREWPAAARVPTPLVDGLSDAELERLNELLPWNCFTLDSSGRPFGRPAWQGKRIEPQPIPDERIVLLDARCDLSDKDVLEIGCFEGVHTVALARLARHVTAVDARVENVVKTLVRTAFSGLRPDVRVVDVDDAAAAGRLPEVDVCHHVGVLYHLLDPVGHLERIAPKVRRLLWLDTHVARPEEADGSYTAAGRSFRVRSYVESGRADPFSGVHAEARWLLLEDLERVLAELGFGRVEVLQRRDERNGLRVLVAAER